LLRFILDVRRRSRVHAACHTAGETAGRFPVGRVFVSCWEDGTRSLGRRHGWARDLLRRIQLRLLSNAYVRE
jgi:hypothetical protein